MRDWDTDIRAHAVAFWGGILWVQQCSDLPSLGWGGLLLPLGALARWNTLWLLPFFCILGMGWSTLYSGILLDERLPPELEGKDLWVEGRIANLPEAFERGSRFQFKVAKAQRAGEEVAIPPKIRLSLYDPEISLHAGERWGFQVRLERPHGFSNPGGFDYEGYLFRRGIRATGYVRSTPPPQRLSRESPFESVDRLRQHLRKRIQATLAPHPLAGIMTVFATGDQSAVQDDQWEVLRRTGTIHLVAISGMHIGLIAGMVYFLTRRLWALAGSAILRLPAPKAAALAALTAAFGYSALAGFAVPTQRALVMLAIVLGALLLNRKVRPSSLLAAALLSVLVYDPLVVMDMGFWLSFASVAVILIAIHGRLREARWIQWLRIQWVIALGLLPFLLTMFQQTSLTGPLANTLAIPLVQLVIVPLTLLGVLGLVLFPEPGAAAIFQTAVWPLTQLWKVLEQLAHFDRGHWVQHTPLLWTLIPAAFGLIWLLSPRGWPARWIGLLWLLPLLAVKPAGPGRGELWFTLVDVGQGLSAVARTQHHTLVFDTGPRYSASFDAGEAALVPYLRHRGVEEIDTLIISHGDNDHIGGAESTLAAFPVQRLLSSVPEHLPRAEPCRAGQSWRWEGVDFQVLHPQGGEAQGNNASCVLKIASRYGNILLPSDIEAEAEGALLARDEPDLQARVLVVPHHGSQTSSTEAFLEAVAPEIALFPVGYQNRYRHPDAQVVQRYKERGIRVLGSPAQGAIRLFLSPDGLDIVRHRQKARRYWLTPVQALRTRELR